MFNYIERKIHNSWLLNHFFSFVWLAVFFAFLKSFLDPLSGLTWMGLGMGVAGWIVMFIAKWPQIKRWDLFTFGVAGLPLWNQRLYKISYALLALGLVMLMTARFTEVFRLGVDEF